jgi:hypothetical protein
MNKSYFLWESLIGYKMDKEDRIDIEKIRREVTNIGIMMRQYPIKDEFDDKYKLYLESCDDIELAVFVYKYYMK